MPTEQLTFPSTQGGTLAARLETPTDVPLVAAAIFAHCFTCSKDSRAAVSVSRALAARGIAVLRFDFTGLGDSEGDFGASTHSGSVADVVAAAAAMGDRLRAPSLLIGHSLGGAAVLSAAPLIPSATAVCTLGAPSAPAHALHLFGPALPQLERDGTAPVTVGGRTFTLSKELVDDLRHSRLLSTVDQLKQALLIMHSPSDEVVSIEHAAELYTAARHPKSFVSLAGADHLLTQREDADYVAEVIAAWVSRYLR